MRILAFDLAYTGPSGWVVWDTEKPDPVDVYGEFAPKTSKFTERSVDAISYLYDRICDVLLIESTGRLDAIVYEITDWHRNLSSKGKNWKTEYAIERQAQRTLGRAEGALVVAAKIWGNTENIIPIGANEAKQEFGAMRKDACARIFSQEHTRFRFIETAADDAEAFLWDTELDMPVSNHISDAFVIAKVMAARLTQQALIKGS